MLLAIFTDLEFSFNLVLIEICLLIGLWVFCKCRDLKVISTWSGPQHYYGLRSRDNAVGYFFYIHRTCIYACYFY